MKHHPNCLIPNKMLSKGRHVIEESEFLIEMLKTTNYGVEPKKEHDCKMLLKTIGIHEFTITSRTINRAIALLRNKFVNEFVNYYNMVVPYLKKYIEIHPTALGVVQADNNGCFYRLMISIPHAKKIFMKIREKLKCTCQ